MILTSFAGNLSILRETAKGSELNIVIDRKGIGMFAEINWVLYLIRYALSLEAIPRIYLASDTYLNPQLGHRDWLAHFFDTTWRAHSRPINHIKGRITCLSQLPFYSELVGRLTLAEARKLQDRFLQPNPIILSKVYAFIEQTIKEPYIGLHWRGTDKIHEAPSVSYKQVLDAIYHVLDGPAKGIACIFLASDCQSQIERIKSAIRLDRPNVRVVCRDNDRKSKDGKPLHKQAALSGPERYLLGEDALIDSLILSESTFLVRTTSFLSAYASIFRPNIPVYLLNLPNEGMLWFPEKEILKSPYTTLMC